MKQELQQGTIEETVDTKEVHSGVEPQQTPKKGHYLAFSTLFIVILVSLGFLWSQGYLTGYLTPSSEKIYLTLVPTDYSTSQGIYGYDLDKEELEEVLVSKINIGHRSDGVFTADDTLFAYILSGANNATNLSQIFVHTKGVEGVKQITNSNTNKKNLRWSLDNTKLAFVTQQEDTLSPNSSRVYITDLEGNESLISEGINPTFSPSGKELLILKDDGLYIIDIESRSGIRVWSMEDGIADTLMTLGMSKDKTKLAWSLPLSKTILLISIESWSPFKASIVDRIETVAFWPTFSLNGYSLAVVEVDLDIQEGDVTNQRLVTYNLETKERSELMSLTGYVLEAMWVSDWQY